MVHGPDGALLERCRMIHMTTSHSCIGQCKSLLFHRCNLLEACRSPSVPLLCRVLDNAGRLLLWASHLFELLSEHEELHLIVERQDTSTGDTTKDVGTSSLEERLDTLLGDNLAGGIERRLVLDGLI